jgi:hypothetical protein
VGPVDLNFKLKPHELAMSLKPTPPPPTHPPTHPPRLFFAYVPRMMASSPASSSSPLLVGRHCTLWAPPVALVLALVLVLALGP